MHSLPPLVLALSLSSSILAGVFAASAQTTEKNHPVDLPTNVSYGEAAAVNASSPADRYFYYDGRWHESYSSVQSAADAAKTANNEPTGYFYYDGQYQPTYSGKRK